jgi:predicted DNA-binding transcriptional regulator AlpA
MNPTEQKLDTYLTTNQLTERYKVHKLTLFRWREQGRGPKFIKIGKRVLYPLKEVVEWERAHLCQNLGEVESK